MFPEKSAVALGYFDGIHTGHREVFRQTMSAAKRLQAQPCAFTFTLPSNSKTKGAFILTQEEKFYRMKQCGIQTILSPAFDTFAHLTPENFVKQILIEQLHACFVVTGENFTFGNQKSGDTHLLSALCEKHNIKCHIVPLAQSEQQPISSSRIRNLLQQGNIEQANDLLQQPYAITGTIQQGKQLGHTFGFPTINLHFDTGMLIPKHGVYVSAVCLENEYYLGVTGISTRPTFGENTAVTCETFLIDFDKAVYGKYARVFLLKYLWDIQTFQNISELQNMITNAVSQAKSAQISFDSLKSFDQ